MSSSLNQVRTGLVVGTGADKKVTLGFKPRSVQIENVDGLVSAYKSDTMLADSAMKRVTAGTATVPAAMITLEDDGFTIGDDADLNVVGEDMHYVAIEAKNE